MTGFYKSKDGNYGYDKADVTRKARRERIRQILEYRKAGACQYCGGAFKQGLFGSKCAKCGKKKDY